jgi:hypothetical protein
MLSGQSAPQHEADVAPEYIWRRTHNGPSTTEKRRSRRAERYWERGQEQPMNNGSNKFYHLSRTRCPKVNFNVRMIIISGGLLGWTTQKRMPDLRMEQPSTKITARTSVPTYATRCPRVNATLNQNKCLTARPTDPPLPSMKEHRPRGHDFGQVQALTPK